MSFQPNFFKLDLQYNDNPPSRTESVYNKKESIVFNTVSIHVKQTFITCRNEKTTYTCTTALSLHLIG